MKKRKRQELRGFFEAIGRRLTALEASSAGRQADSGPSVIEPPAVQVQTVADPLADAQGTIARAMAERVRSATSVAGLIDAVAAGLLTDALDAAQGVRGRRRRGALALRGEHGHFARNGASTPDCRLCADPLTVDVGTDEIKAHGTHRAQRAVGVGGNGNGNIH